MKNVFIAFLICASINPLYAQEEIHCPSDGVVKIDSETNELICCKDGWAYQWYNEEKKLERYMYAELCGCPDGGIVVDYLCCKNNLSLGGRPGEEAYAFADPVCGCPKGGDEKNGRCCLNGKGWNKNKQDYVSIEAECGCPDGGYSQFLNSGQYACCKKGYYLNRNGYSEWDSWGTCKCQGSVLCYLRQFKDRLMRRIKGENECCA